MAKRAFNLGKFLKVSHNEVCYEQDGENIYLCDKRGYVGIQTNDLTVLPDMEKRGIVLTEKSDLKQKIEQLLAKCKEDIFTYNHTGIQFPYWDSSAGKKKTLTMFRDYDQEYSVKLADAAHTEIFDPELIIGGKVFTDPIIMICSDCYGFVMPIRVSKQHTLDQKDNMKHLLDYFNSVR